ncbi:MAG: F0F1 ATP synthase subunit epsilon [Actinomycetota bacterium]
MTGGLVALEVDVTSADEELFSGEASFVLARTVDGEIGILPGHAPLLAQLVESEVKVRESGGGEKRFSISGGFMTVKDDKVIILAEGSEDHEG